MKDLMKIGQKNPKNEICGPNLQDGGGFLTRRNTVGRPELVQKTIRRKSCTSSERSHEIEIWTGLKTVKQGR